MRLFKNEKSTEVVRDSEKKGPGDPRNQSAPSQDAATATAPEAAYDPSAPAGWYPDPVDPSAVRYWDGAAWAERTQPISSPPPAPAPVGQVVAPALPEVQTPAKPEPAPPGEATNDGGTARAESTVDDTPATKQDTDTWVAMTEKAVANARSTGTAAAWRNAAQAAGVVADMAQTMRVTAHAHQIAEQLAQAATTAAQQAHTATLAAADATRTAEQTAQAAKVAAQQARAATLAATSARQKAEQTAQAAPRAVESAQVATQAAANAKSTVDQLDHAVANARQANTPEAWSKALQMATAAWTIDADQASPPADETNRPVEDPGAD